MQAGLFAFTLSPTQWIQATNAIGLIFQAGRYGGTYAISDITFKFANWVSVEFELYQILHYPLDHTKYNKWRLVEKEDDSTVHSCWLCKHHLYENNLKEHLFYLVFCHSPRIQGRRSSVPKDLLALLKQSSQKNNFSISEKCVSLQHKMSFCSLS